MAIGFIIFPLMIAVLVVALFLVKDDDGRHLFFGPRRF